MDLDVDLDLIDLGPPRVGPGRRTENLAAEFVRELTRADLETPAVVPQQPSALKRIRDSHHALARTLATGAKEAEASAITGFSLSRISVLKADPQFAELLEFYREQAKEIAADFQARMATLGLDSVQELQARLEEKPEEFSITQLRELARDMADRVGHAPQRGPTSVTNVQVNLSEAMSRARERVKALPERPTRVIDHE